MEELKGGTLREYINLHINENIKRRRIKFNNKKYFKCYFIFT